MRTKSSTKSTDGEKLDDGTDGAVGDVDEILEVEAEGQRVDVSCVASKSEEGTVCTLTLWRLGDPVLLRLRPTSLRRDEFTWNKEEDEDVSKGSPLKKGVGQTYKGCPSSRTARQRKTVGKGAKRRQHEASCLSDSASKSESSHAGKGRVRCSESSSLDKPGTLENGQGRSSSADVLELVSTSSVKVES